MIEPRATDDEPGQKVSDLMDGRLTPQEASRALDEPGLQETWGVYHLIGDVLRSPDLAACHGGSAFVERLRAQLPQTPQELPAAPLEASAPRAQAANDPVFRWKMAAGVACLAAAALWGWNLWNGQGGLQDAPAQLARAPAPAVAQASAPQAAASVQAVAAGGDEAAPVMLRDARLDALLAAHWQSSRRASALGNAQGFLRGAAYEEAGR